MNDENLDMLQIKIERARDELPEETKKAINSVAWRDIILGMREKKGYSYEQLEDLELETELLLCGLTNPEDYPSELGKRMRISKPQVGLLVSEMNELVFKKIRETLIQNTEKKELFIKKTETPEIPTNVPKINEMSKETTSINHKEENILNKAGINIVETMKTDSALATTKQAESLASQKLSGTFKIDTTTSEYSLDNKTKTISVPTGQKVTDGASKLNVSKTDPYRMSPDE